MKGNINLISYDCYQQATEKQLAGLKWKENRVYYISEIRNEKIQDEIYGYIDDRCRRLSLSTAVNDIYRFDLLKEFLNEKCTSCSSITDKKWEELERSYKAFLYKKGLALYVRRNRPDRRNVEQQNSAQVSFLKMYYEYVVKCKTADIPENEKDVWDMRKLDIVPRSNPIRGRYRLDFREIRQRGEGVGESYETGMLAKNQISGLLKMKIKYMDGVPVYCYDITSRQPVSRLFESRPAGENQVRSFFLQLYETLDRMEAYLLGDGGILLDPELIYADPETFQMGFCVVPGRKEDFSSQLSLFLQYLMKNIDHRDRECVVLTYGLYQTSMKYNYGMEDMMALLSKEEAKDLKTEKDLLMERKGDGKTETRPEIKTEKEDMAEESSLYGLENDAQEERELFSEGGTYANNGWSLWKKLLLLFFTAVMAAGGTWFLYGWSVLRKMWVYGAAGGGIAILGTVLLHMMRGKVRGLLPGKYGGTGVKEPENSWQVFYEETEEAQNAEKAEKIRQGSAPEKIPGYVPAREKTAERQQEKQTEELQEECQTMLLTVKEEPDHMLVSAGEENEDIAVGYVPFVIGKHTGLADYILNKSTVSRFHVRITEEDGQYFLTDLNSTNGTKVNGRLLAANEKVVLSQGDEVWIAEEKYLWR